MRIPAEALKIGAAVVCFAICVAIFMHEAGLIKDMKDAYLSGESGTGDMAYVSYREPAEPKVTYADLIASLAGGPFDYDVEVDGVMFSKGVYTPVALKSYTIAYHPKYVKTVVYDADGQITLIRYRGV